MKCLSGNTIDGSEIWHPPVEVGSLSLYVLRVSKTSQLACRTSSSSVGALVGS